MGEFLILALLKRESVGFFFGDLAQMAEHMFCKHRVLGSIPKISTTILARKRKFWFFRHSTIEEMFQDLKRKNLHRINPTRVGKQNMRRRWETLG